MRDFLIASFGAVEIPALIRTVLPVKHVAYYCTKKAHSNEAIFVSKELNEIKFFSYFEILLFEMEEEFEFIRSLTIKNGTPLVILYQTGFVCVDSVDGNEFRSK